ncbi:SMP-30/gluconolactonase/LRE family protein [Cesiribacter sp. SM1]|uniref:SMP-30/gluconolactonase/LRE family protein n=1 Tax=Cesiribacter sp. SM1 TaxID=2861196 RepID=UPI001CD7CE9C|nr:SMP-30/gluconolactonase/LRE family protein [Cesiribacter sp. SM1]
MKRIFTPTAVVTLFMSMLLSSCSYLDDIWDETPIDSPDKISFTQENLFPEGVEYDKQMNRFLVSSITQGSIGVVQQNGSYMEWINEPDIPSTIGIHIDQPRKRLLVAVSDNGASVKSSEATINSLAGLAAYDLRTGERIFYTRMDALLPDAPHFANDVAVDNKGNAYVTDSFTGVIYKVDEAGNASIFYQDDALTPAPGAFGLNGIDYDPRGYLIVAKSDDNALLRFPIRNPADYSVIDIPVALNNPDGLYLKNNKELVVVNNANGGENANVITLNSTNMWQSTEVTDVFETGPVFPTTATEYLNGQVYVLYAHLNVLFSGNTQEEFQIVKAE